MMTQDVPIFTTVPTISRPQYANLCLNMSTGISDPLRTLARRGAGADDKFAEFKWFTIGSLESQSFCLYYPSSSSCPFRLTGIVLGLFGISFLGFAITELWGARIQRELTNRKLMKGLKSMGETNKEYQKRRKVLEDDYGVDEGAAGEAFQDHTSKDYKEYIGKVRK